MSLGTDTTGAEFLAVFTQGDSFVLSTLTAALAPKRARQKRTSWVFEIDELPTNFCGFVRPKIVAFGDFRVTYGLDAFQREFLSVLLPKQKLNLLFRNPTSLSAEPWNKRRANPVGEGTTIVATLRVKTALGSSVGGESTGDAELDAMLAALT